MKVAKIEVTQKGNYLTHTDGADKLDKVIYTQKEPPWKLGDDLSPDNFELSPTGKSYFRKFKKNPEVAPPAGETPSVPPHNDKPAVQRYQKDDDAIMLQVAFKGIVELDMHHMPPGGDTYLDRVMQNTFKSYAILQMIKAGTYHEK